MTARPMASLSLDLDNLWSYMKTHGDQDWESAPSYLDLVVPRFLQVLDRHKLKMTVFIVGRDADDPVNAAALKSIVDAGHEVGNHSYRHEPWLHLYSREAINTDLARTEDAIERVTGVKPTGFRGPGYSLSEDVLNVLLDRGYAFDCSTFPTFIGPLARAYYFMNSRLSTEQRDDRKRLFGTVREGLRPLTPYQWHLREQQLLEIPVTTMPLLRAPFHFSYLHWLAKFNETLANGYYRVALSACRLRQVEPSLLLHPLDFLGGDDVSELSFFPAMQENGAVKMRRIDGWIERLASDFDVLPMSAYAETIRDRVTRSRAPDFPPADPVDVADTKHAAE